MGKNNFKDHFSVHSEKYSKYRPDYPAVLFKFLSSITPGHDPVSSRSKMQSIIKKFHTK